MENIFDVKRRIDNIFENNMKTVAYLRLSQEDGDGESSSISNQRRIITKFAQDRGMVIDEFYIDDGYSGFTMDRPAFNRLKNDLNNNIVGTIIFKDLSRLSRNNAKGQLFLENILEDNKRVLTVYEGYDTLDPKTHKMVGIYGWINEDYIREASMKTKDAINALQKEGVYINTVPYGYMKDPFNKRLYYVDNVAAPYVKKIFDLYIGGMGVRAIAEKLNAENVPTYSALVKQRLESHGKSSKFKSALWNGDTIQRMITNTFYIGILTLNKTASRTINGKRIHNPSDKYYVFEDAHDPIIDKATFQLAQEIIAQRRKVPYRGTKIKRSNIFAGVLRCADCGRLLTSSSCNPNTRYVCLSYNKYGTGACTSHAVGEFQLTECLIAFLKDCREGLIKIIEDFDDIFKREFSKQGDASNLEKDLKRVRQEIKILMEQKMREIMKNPSMSDIIDDMYAEAMNEKYKMISYLEKQIEDIVNMETKENEIRRNFKSTVNMLDEIINTKELTKKQVLLLVDKIVVHENGSLDIYLKGDLHELCSNKVNIKESLMDNINRYMTDYILDNKNYIAPTSCWKYIRDRGILIGYIKFSRYFYKLVEDSMIVKIGGERQGFKFVLTDNALKSYTHYNNVIDIRGGLSYNNVTLKQLINISNLGMNFNQMHRKMLF